VRLLQEWILNALGIMFWYMVFVVVFAVIGDM
jgi:hypothetical protein